MFPSIPEIRTKGISMCWKTIPGGVEILAEINLGFHEIPLNRIAGTRTAARSNSFAGNFMPLLGDDTEFAIKWKKV